MSPRSCPRKRGQRRGRAITVVLAGVPLLADPAGALYWPEQGLLAVADLHLEKGSSFAARGQLLPPYDTAATLARLARLDRALCAALRGGAGRQLPRRRRPGAPCRTTTAKSFSAHAARPRLDLDHRQSRSASRPPISAALSRRLVAIGAVTFRHLPTGAAGEIAGHLHPVARVAHRGRAVSRRCFAADGKRMVMPAFGAFTGGLNVRDAAFADVFGTLAFTAHMLGEGRLYAFAAKRCLPD